MQPSRQHCLFAFAISFVLTALAPRINADVLTITSTPPGATLEIDGKAVGPTPYKIDYPGGYFHKTHSVFGTRLQHAMMLRISMDGYLSQQLTLTTGPFEWVAVNGHHHGNYFLLRSDHFSVELEPVRTHGSSADVNERAGPLQPPAPPNDSQAIFGTVTITSESAGADIFIDGQFVGQTPSTLRVLAGTREIQVKSDGKRSWTRTLNVTGNNQITLKANLDTASP